MGRSRHYWYEITKRIIMRYPNLDDEIPIERSFRIAIDNALDEVAQHKDSEARRKALDLVLFKQTHTIAGAALKLNYSERNVQYWINDFVNDVGRSAGFEAKNQ